ncbi:MAG: hypothetical protein WC436_05050 [Candidatus Babeliales bacterium]
MLAVSLNNIKKTLCLFFLLLFFLNFKNSNAIINKSAIEKTQKLLCFAIVVDQLLPNHYKIWPKLNIEFNNPKFLQFKNCCNSKYNIYMPAFINNILLSATEENEDFVSAIINILIQIKIISQDNNLNSAKEIGDLFKSNIGLSIICEKAAEILANKAVNNFVKQKILKRVLKIITFTSIKILADYLRSQKIESNYQQYFKFNTIKYINIFVEKTFIEFLAEFLQRFIKGKSQVQKC